MAVDPSILAALTTAVSSDPENLPLRLHFVELLLDAARADAAMEHCAALLASHPHHPEVLRLAELCALARGQAEEAAAYARTAAAGAGVADLSVPEPVVDRRGRRAGGPQLRLIRGGRAEPVEPIFGRLERPRLCLDQVSGLDWARQRLQLAGGQLLYGPPACGKGLLARAIAGDLDASFYDIVVPRLLAVSLDGGCKQLRSIFEVARSSLPCVVLLRHLEAVAGESMQVALSTLVTELDQARVEHPQLYVLATSESPWDLPVELWRPGRLERAVLVPPPDAEGRAAILAQQLRSRPIRDLELSWLCTMTEGFSAADLAGLCEVAAELAMSEALKRGKAVPISRRHAKRALDNLQPGTPAWFETARGRLGRPESGPLERQLSGELAEYLRSRW